MIRLFLIIFLLTPRSRSDDLLSHVDEFFRWELESFDLFIDCLRCVMSFRAEAGA